MPQILERSVIELQALLGSGELSSQQLTQFYLDRINELDGTSGLNAIQTVNPEALKEAQSLDRERSAGRVRSRLHGLPVIVKDNYLTKGMATTAGSALFSGHDPGYDAHSVARLKEAGAIILAKANMHEFAYGITTVGSSFGETKNPYGQSRNPGGSSGGTGAAVAANFAVLGMGSDTCGSIRIPSAHNNLVGLRGTQGLSSRFGIIPLSHTQDIGGPLAKSVEDLAIALDVTVGPDVKDEQTKQSAGRIPASFFDALQIRRELKVGVMSDYLEIDEADAPVAKVFQQALADISLKAQWDVVQLSSPGVKESLARPFDGHYVLIADFAEDINRYLMQHPQLNLKDLAEIVSSDQPHRQVLPSLHASLNLHDAPIEDYQREMEQRQKVRDALVRLMDEHNLDVLAYPTIRQIAAPRGEPQGGTNCRLAANSGLPAISFPAGFSVEGMPVGLELLGRAWQEQLLLDAAYTSEQLLPRRQLPHIAR
ncbi:MAG: amidase [Pseudomonadota bacterium]